MRREGQQLYNQEGSYARENLLKEERIQELGKEKAEMQSRMDRLSESVHQLQVQLVEANRKTQDSLAAYHDVQQRLESSEEDLLAKVQSEWQRHVEGHQSAMKLQTGRAERAELEKETAGALNDVLEAQEKADNKAIVLGKEQAPPPKTPVAPLGQPSANGPHRPAPRSY